MRLVLLGNDNDALGFRLAGVDSVVCTSAADAAAAIDRVVRDDPDAMLVFTDSVGRLISDRLVEWAKSGSGPLFTVLPPP